MRAGSALRPPGRKATNTAGLQKKSTRSELRIGCEFLHPEFLGSENGGSGIKPVSREPQRLLIPVGTCISPASARGTWTRALGLLLPPRPAAKQPGLFVADACPGQQPSQHPPFPPAPLGRAAEEGRCTEPEQFATHSVGAGQQRRQHLAFQPPATDFPCRQFQAGKGRVKSPSSGGSGWSTAPPRPRSRALLFPAFTRSVVLLWEKVMPALSGKSNLMTKWA